MPSAPLPYDPSDFDKNPEKYRLFRTATLTIDVPDKGLKAGSIVGIRYFPTMSNRKDGKVTMPIYDVRINGQLITRLNADAFAGFTL